MLGAAILRVHLDGPSSTSGTGKKPPAYAGGYVAASVRTWILIHMRGGREDAPRPPSLPSKRPMADIGRGPRPKNATKSSNAKIAKPSRTKAAK